MKRVLIICAHRPQRSPSQRYRFEQYLPFLKEQGYEFTWSYLIKEKEDKNFYAAGHYLLKARIILRAYWQRWLDLSRANQFDLVFIQRESVFTGSTFFEAGLAKKKIPFIFDFDDSIWMADTSPANKKFEWLKRPEKLFESLRLASAVTAGNAYLADKARYYNANTTIIPTSIDTGIHRPLQLPHERIVIGWSGSISTIKHFQLVRPVLKRLFEKYGSRLQFMIIADKTYSDPELPITSAIWSVEEEVTLLNKFDIGLMPLPDDYWSRGKCGLKGLSYMACGVATVMSPVGVNTEIIQDGQNGRLASTEEEWFEVLSELIEHLELRKRLAAAGRQTVEQKYSVNALKALYLKVFQSVNTAR
jgi:glycosyltransferase involved in cell wall biosynthesis